MKLYLASVILLIVFSNNLYSNEWNKSVTCQVSPVFFSRGKIKQFFPMINSIKSKTNKVVLDLIKEEEEVKEQPIDLGKAIFMVKDPFGRYNLSKKPEVGNEKILEHLPGKAEETLVYPFGYSLKIKVFFHAKASASKLLKTAGEYIDKEAGLTIMKDHINDPVLYDVFSTIILLNNDDMKMTEEKYIKEESKVLFTYSEYDSAAFSMSARKYLKDNGIIITKENLNIPLLEDMDLLNKIIPLMIKYNKLVVKKHKLYKLNKIDEIDEINKLNNLKEFDESDANTLNEYHLAFLPEYKKDQIGSGSDYLDHLEMEVSLLKDDDIIAFNKASSSNPYRNDFNPYKTINNTVIHSGEYQKYFERAKEMNMTNFLNAIPNNIPMQVGVNCSINRKHSKPKKDE